MSAPVDIPWGVVERRVNLFLLREPAPDRLRICMSCGKTTEPRPVTLGIVMGLAAHPQQFEKVSPPVLLCLACFRAHVREMRLVLLAIERGRLDEVIDDVDRGRLRSPSA